MRFLLLASLMAFTAQSKAVEALDATDKELVTARQLYSQSLQEEFNKQWLVESSPEKNPAGKDFLVMHLVVDEVGKMKEARIIESEGKVRRLEQITMQAIRRAKFKPVPLMLAQGLKERNLAMPSILIRVPIPYSAGKSQPDEVLTFTDWYSTLIRRRVEAKWNSLRTLKKDTLTFGMMKLYFLVGLDGKIATITIVDGKDSNKVLTEMTMDAIHSTELPVMPPQLVEELKSTGLKHLKLEYTVLIY